MKRISRRDFLKTSALVSGAALLAACKPTATETPAEVPQAEAAATEEIAVEPQPAGDILAITTNFGTIEIAPEAINPLAMPTPVAAEGVFFSGGYGHAYIQYAADIFAKVHPDSSMSVEGIQGVGEKLRPRFVGGNPPDAIDNSGAGALDMGALYSEGQLTDMGPLFAALSLDTPGKTVAETLFPGSQKGGLYDGKQMALMIAYTAGGLWYSSTLFEEKGWKYPATWDEMLALCETIKTAGTAPWTYQGKYPSYVEFGVLQGQIYKKGGIQPMIDIDNLVDGAWLAPAVLDSAKELQQIVDGGYIMEGTEGLNHTESQAEWLNGKAVFIPCGNWLENEMKEVTPENFKMVMGEVPGEGHAVLAEGGEPFIVPSAAKNVLAGLEFMRCQISKDAAKYFAVEISAMMPVIGGTEGVEVSLGMASSVAVVEACGENVFPFLRYGGWYSDMGKACSAAMGELMTGRYTAEQYCEECQAAADKTKADPEITKFTRTE
jgi:N-acetylglucosamine transport system substrate-binding protein